MDSTFLQIFLLLNVFLMGALMPLAFKHALAHFKKSKEAEAPQPIASPTPVNLPPMVRQRLVKEAEQHFLEQLDRSIAELQHDLRSTSEALNKQLQQLGSQVAISERGRYSTMLEDLRKRTEIALSAAQAELDQHQVELKAQMSQAVLAEQQRLIKQIDAKLADAVGSFLTETLQHNVDLGSQTEYLVALLEQHKDDFKKEVANEVAAAK